MPAKATAPAKSDDFASLFADLKAMLQRHSKGMRVATDKPADFVLETEKAILRGRPMYFAAVQIKKNYVSFHFVAVYCNPALKVSLSPELKKRMQGKGCFNFIKPEPELFKELEELVARGAEFFQTADWDEFLANARCE